MIARPVVTSVSHATRPTRSCARIASRMESEIWSAILSGCPSVTDSDVNRYRPLRLMSFELLALHRLRARLPRANRPNVSDWRPDRQPRAPSPARMKAIVHRAEPRLEHVGVNLR